MYTIVPLIRILHYQFYIKRSYQQCQLINWLIFIISWIYQSLLWVPRKTLRSSTAGSVWKSNKEASKSFNFKFSKIFFFDKMRASRRHRLTRTGQRHPHKGVICLLIKCRNRWNASGLFKAVSLCLWGVLLPAWQISFCNTWEKSIYFW